jgi:hypothetical protein
LIHSWYWNLFRQRCRLLCCPRTVWCHQSSQRAVGQLRWFQTNTVGCPDWDFPWFSSVVRQIANATTPSVDAAPRCWIYQFPSQRASEADDRPVVTTSLGTLRVKIWGTFPNVSYVFRA